MHLPQNLPELIKYFDDKKQFIEGMKCLMSRSHNYNFYKFHCYIIDYSTKILIIYYTLNGEIEININVKTQTLNRTFMSIEGFQNGKMFLHESDTTRICNIASKLMEITKLMLSEGGDDI